MKALARAGAAAFLAALLALIALEGWVAATPLPGLGTAMSRTVLDRHGVLLRAWPAGDGAWRLPAELAAVDPGLIAGLIAYEDKRFRRHGGIDGIAALRAAWQAATSGRITSGASTLTMQVARLLSGGGTGSMAGKLAQARLALALERRLTKDAILALYLHRAPYGGNIEGIRAASLTWFGKEPRRLTPAEAALLIALPQSPEARRPDRSPEAALAARNRVLDRLQAAGVLTAEDAGAARAAPLAAPRRDFPLLAPHLAEQLVAAVPAGAVATTLDAGLQAEIQTLLRSFVLDRGDPALSAALIIADFETGEILAHAGSADYLDPARAGFIDMTRALRSPGSALKPFIYGMAFEAGLAHPESLTTDRPVTFGDYAPQNFDRIYLGTVPLREALQTSRNIPAVALLDAIGPARLAARLRASGAALVLPPGKGPGLPLALGGAGISLADLTALYAGLARGGASVTLSPLPGGSAEGPALLAEGAAWQVADILSGTPPPRDAPAGVLAFKTGTSWGGRDAWAFGFDGRHVAGIWVGRANGAAVPGAMGADLAAPLLFQAFARLGTRPAPLPAPPSWLPVLRQSDLPLHLQVFEGRGEVLSARRLEIAFPPDGARLDLAAGGVILKANNGILPLSWLIDGRPLPAAPTSREAVWPVTAPGFSAITVIDAEGASARVHVALGPG
jgi:penicillin-binding protein 1C